MGILDMPPGRITGGEILFEGRDLLKMSDEERRQIRGPKIAMIFQDALSSLNPVLTWAISSARCSGSTRAVQQGGQARAIELMERVRIPAARAAGERLPAPVQRRYASTHHDRHGVGSGTAT